MSSMPPSGGKAIVMAIDRFENPLQKKKELPDWAKVDHDDYDPARVLEEIRLGKLTLE